MVIGEPARARTLDDVDPWFRSRSLPGVVVAELTAIPLPPTPPRALRPTRAENRFCQLWFVDADLPATWDDTFACLGDDLAAAGLGTSSSSPPSAPPSRVTNTYTDQLLAARPATLS